MMLKSKLATIVGALILAGSAFAQPQLACPDINDIKAEGVPMAEEAGADLFMAYHFSNYNTDTFWVFGIGPLQASSQDEAVDLGSELLENINGAGMPDYMGSTLFCSYETGDSNLYAVAISMENGLGSPLKLKQYIKSSH